MFVILGMIAKVTQTLNLSIIPETSIRRFRNKCDIVEEQNSSSKHGINVKFFSLITRN